MNHDPHDLQGQAERKKETEEQRALRRTQEIADFKWLMRMPQFRRFTWRLLEEAGVFSPTFRPGQPDVSAFLEGQRNQGLFVLREVHDLTPELYEVMVKEQKIYAG